jgi:hypothetical protein
MIPGFVNATLQAAPVMNKGGGIVIGEVSASVECFVHERAPTRGVNLPSLARRRPQSQSFQDCAVVHALPSRVGRPRRGPTSEIPDRSLLGSALGLRALAFSVRAHFVRPNYALQRTGNQPHFQLWPQRAAAERER